MSVFLQCGQKDGISVKVIIAMDSFKGSCSAYEAGEAVCRGILRAVPTAQVVNIPVADGGEGTVEAVIAKGRGVWMPCQAVGPLGDAVSAGYGVLDGETAVIEMSAASGLMLVPPGRLNPLRATTYGTGELIKSALDEGYRKILIGLGGSATNDGGAGMAQALGVSLKDEDGFELGFGGAALARLHTVDISHMDERLRECQITCAVDVKNPLCGPDGASAVFGPQKGATPGIIEELDAALAHYARVIESQLGIRVAEMPGAGAAGGLGAGLYAFCQAAFQPGIDAVLDIVGFDEKLDGADFVVTGEGRIDGQSLSGKVPVGVARRVKEQGSAIPVFALVGALGAGAEEVYGCGIDGIYAIADGPMTLEDSCKNVLPLLDQSALSLAHTVRAVRDAFAQERLSDAR